MIFFLEGPGLEAEEEWHGVSNCCAVWDSIGGMGRNEVGMLDGHNTMEVEKGREDRVANMGGWSAC